MDQGKIIDIKLDPSPRDLRIFAGLWVIFFVVLAKLAFFTDRAIMTMAVVTSLLFLISMALNRDYPRRDQLWGLLIPGGLWTIFAFERLAHILGGWWAEVASWQPWTNAPRLLTLAGNHAQWVVLWTVVAIAVAGGVLIFVNPRVAKVIYRTWMFAALPIGWTFSHVILGAIYFGLITPMGLAMRFAFRRDPMQRRLDRQATTYWRPHQPPADAKRYFRQF